MEKLTGAIFGFAVGDALGVPVEFYTREQLESDPVVDMRGHGTHDQPPGTWSDDTSMTLATLEAFNQVSVDRPERLAMLNFEKWLNDGLFTPYGSVFDVGNTTQTAIGIFSCTSDERQCGQGDAADNGNGALMRMLPLAFVETPLEEKLEMTRRFAALTHSHEINLTACCFFVELAHTLLHNSDMPLLDCVRSAYCSIASHDDDGHFRRLQSIETLTLDEIKSTGYVVDTLEAAVWCLLTTQSYKDAVLTAVNLGGDTDTVGAITGGLAGLVYGIEAIPTEWLKKLARLDWIMDICKGSCIRTFEGKNRARITESVARPTYYLRPYSRYKKNGRGW